MSKLVAIEALRPFNRVPQGDICEVGDVFSVEQTRAEELERLGLARRTGTKAASAAANKMAPAPANKEFGPIAVTRRAPTKSAAEN